MKMTEPLERVLRVFLDDPSAHHHGYDLMKATKLASGTLYPMLNRLKEEGVLISRSEPSQKAGRPPRKVYEMTGDGVRIVRQELAETSGAKSRVTTGSRRPALGGADR